MFQSKSDHHQNLAHSSSEDNQLVIETRTKGELYRQLNTFYSLFALSSSGRRNITIYVNPMVSPKFSISFK